MTLVPSFLPWPSSKKVVPKMRRGCFRIRNQNANLMPRTLRGAWRLETNPCRRTISTYLTAKGDWNRVCVRIVVAEHATASSHIFQVFSSFVAIQPCDIELSLLVFPKQTLIGLRACVLVLFSIYACVTTIINEIRGQLLFIAVHL